MKEIIIKTETEEEAYRIGDSLHNVLAGNRNYMYNLIVLNIETPKEIHIWIDEASTYDLVLCPVCIKSKITPPIKE